MKFVRVLSRIALLLLAAAAFVGLTQIYGGFVQRRFPDPDSQVERLHRPFAPQLSHLPEFVGDSMILALFALAGRVVFRLRLSARSRSEETLISLKLHARKKDRSL